MLRRAHRYAWEQEYGPIPAGLELHHRCGRRACVRLDHLQLVTRREHTAIHNSPWHMNRAKREATHCIHGHEFTPANTYIRRNGCRTCRACHAATEGKRRARARAKA